MNLNVNELKLYIIIYNLFFKKNRNRYLFKILQYYYFTILGWSVAYYGITIRTCDRRIRSSLLGKNTDYSKK